MSAPPAADRPLWLVLPGAPASVLAGWLAWVAGSALAAPLGAALLGRAGLVVAVLAGGWCLARRAPGPLEWLRSYHLDDDEVTAMGPGRRVWRLPWHQVDSVTQDRMALRLTGGGLRVALPLDPLLRSGAWGALVARIVPGLAGTMWARLDEGDEVELRAPSDPRLDLLGWWAYAPALVACAVGDGSPIAALALALGERLVALGRAHVAAVSLHRSGVALRAGLRSLFVSWRRAGVLRDPQGLVVGATESQGGLVAARLANFWAAAPVIETRAQLGPVADAHVTFRVRLAEGRLAVVGEIERPA